MELNEFQSIFKNLTKSEKGNYEPFPWQERLFKEFVKGDIPPAIDIPTGLGKTSVLAVWLIALATQDKLPRRLLYVVDRRTVVDQATSYAETLRKNLEENKELSKKMGLHDKPLRISCLRGQFADNREWLEDVVTPAIVIGTVDMIGSRLLFQGYGVSPRMRPMHAAMLGIDSLLVLDEAHLSQPFLQMAKQVKNMIKLGEDTQKGIQVKGIQVMSLSATMHNTTDALGLEQEDEELDIVKNRLEACKLLSVVDPEDKEAKVFADEATDFTDEATAFAVKAIELAKNNKGKKILIYRNFFDEARKIGDAIRKKLGRNGSDRVGLLTGRRRGKERDDLVRWLENNGFLAATDVEIPESVFLVATSAGEVGIDIDADHMLCDLVSWERMVQRLGRVNRRGEKEKSFVVVWDLKNNKASEEDKKIRENTLKLLEKLERHPDNEECHKAGPSALSALALDPSVMKEDVYSAISPTPKYPPLTQPLVESWAMTSLPKHAGRPDVAPWLRGWTNEEPQVTLAWRRFLPGKEIEGGEPKITSEEVKSYFSVAPLRSSEKLEIEVSRASEWMKNIAKEIYKRLNSEEGGPSPNTIAALFLKSDNSLSEPGYFSFSKFSDLENFKKKEKIINSEVKTILMNYGVCGLDCDGMLSYKHKVLPSTGDEDSSSRKFKDMIACFSSLEKSEEGLVVPDSIDTDERVLVGRFTTKVGKTGNDEEGFAIFRKKGAEDESEDARSICGKEQTLSEHTERVVEFVSRFTSRLVDKQDLDSEVAKVLIKAAKYHDVGKGADVWQKAAGVSSKETMAKSNGRGVNWSLLNGYRHEFGSLVMAKKMMKKVEGMPDDYYDLILHLIASHHGFSRPLIRHAGCSEGPPSAMLKIAGEASLRYERLSRKYDPWRLAWLETILRASDQQASSMAESNS